MSQRLTLRYDEVGDILSIDKVLPYEEQDSDELDEGIVMRMHPTTGEVENLEILFCMARFRRGETLELPVEAVMKISP